MKIYVAGKTQDWRRVRETQNLLVLQGHEITYDWVPAVIRYGEDDATGPDVNETGPEVLLEQAEADREGVREADVVVALGHPDVLGTIVEIGMALAEHKPVILVGEFRDSVFWYFPEVTRVKGLDELEDALRTSAPA